MWTFRFYDRELSFTTYPEFFDSYLKLYLTVHLFLIFWYIPYQNTSLESSVGGGGGHSELEVQNGSPPPPTQIT